MLQLWRFSTLDLLLSLLKLAVENVTQEVLTENAKLLNKSLLWESYRSNLYFEVRSRISKSLLTSLMWAKVNKYQSVQNSMIFYILLLRLLAYTLYDMCNSLTELLISRLPLHMRATWEHDRLRLRWIQCSHWWASNHSQREQYYQHHDEICEDTLWHARRQLRRLSQGYTWEQCLNKTDQYDAIVRWHKRLWESKRKE